jgi:hypothetical protein
METGRLRVEVIPGTDHIFAPPDALERLLHVCSNWMDQHCSRTNGAPRTSSTHETQRSQRQAERVEMTPDQSLTHATGI